MSTSINQAYKFNGCIKELMPHLYGVPTNFHKQIKPEIEFFYGDSIRKAINTAYALKTVVYEDTDWMSSYEGSTIHVYFHDDDIYIQLFGLLRDKHLGDEFNEKLLDFSFDDRCLDDSNEDWFIRRQQIWDEIFSHSTIPNYAGLSYNVSRRKSLLIDIVRNIRNEKSIYGLY